MTRAIPEAQETEKGQRRKLASETVLTLGGIVTSLVAAFANSWIAQSAGIDVSSRLYWFVLPVGPVLVGAIAASGYYLASLVTRRPAKPLVVFNMIIVGLSTYALAQYLTYQALTLPDGTPASRGVDFLTYYQSAIESTSLRLHLHEYMMSGPDSGGLGQLGRAFEGLRVIGFLLAGFVVYARLRKRPYCEKCDRYLRRRERLLDTVDPAKVDGFAQRLSFDAFDLEANYERVIGSQPIAGFRAYMQSCRRCDQKQLRFIAVTHRKNKEHERPFAIYNFRGASPFQAEPSGSLAAAETGETLPRVVREIDRPPEIEPLSRVPREIDRPPEVEPLPRVPREIDRPPEIEPLPRAPAAEIERTPDVVEMRMREPGDEPARPRATAETLPAAPGADADRPPEMVEMLPRVPVVETNRPREMRKTPPRAPTPKPDRPPEIETLPMVSALDTARSLDVVERSLREPGAETARPRAPSETRPKVPAPEADRPPEIRKTPPRAPTPETARPRAPSETRPPVPAPETDRARETPKTVPRAPGETRPKVPAPETDRPRETPKTVPKAPAPKTDRPRAPSETRPPVAAPETDRPRETPKTVPKAPAPKTDRPRAPSETRAKVPAAETARPSDKSRLKAVRCWSCNTSLEVNEENRGKAVNCPRCGVKQAIPK